jgi:hypothetical protein
MSKEKKSRKPAVGELQSSLQGSPIPDEELAKMYLEQARQEVKQLAEKEREGERINRELLHFRMRRPR